MIPKVNLAPIFKATDTAGAPLVGGRLSVFQAGSTAPATVYADAAQQAAHPHPIVLDTNGEAIIHWPEGVFKLRLEDAAGALLWEIDNYGVVGDRTAVTGQELLTNPDFLIDSNGDQLPDGWRFTPYTNGTLSLDTTQAISGDRSVRIDSPGGGTPNGGGWLESTRFPVAAGAVYHLSFHIKSSISALHNQVSLVWFDGTGAPLPVTPETVLYNDQATNPLSWTAFNREAAAPAGARYGAVRLYGGIDDTVNGGSCHFDAIRLRPAFPPASATESGFFGTTDKQKLDGIEAGARVAMPKAEIDALGIDAATLSGNGPADTLLARNALAEIATAPDTPGGPAPTQTVIDTRTAAARATLGLHPVPMPNGVSGIHLADHSVTGGALFTAGQQVFPNGLIATVPNYTTPTEVARFTVYLPGTVQVEWDISVYPTTDLYLYVNNAQVPGQIFTYQVAGNFLDSAQITVAAEDTVQLLVRAHGSNAPASGITLHAFRIKSDTPFGVYP